MTMSLSLYTLMLFGSWVSSKRSGAETLTLVRSLKGSFVGRISAASASSLVKKQFLKKTLETILNYYFLGSLMWWLELLHMTTFVFVWSSK